MNASAVWPTPVNSPKLGWLLLASAGVHLIVVALAFLYPAPQQVKLQQADSIKVALVNFEDPASNSPEPSAPAMPEPVALSQETPAPEESPAIPDLPSTSELPERVSVPRPAPTATEAPTQKIKSSQATTATRPPKLSRTGQPTATGVSASGSRNGSPIGATKGLVLTRSPRPPYPYEALKRHYQGSLKLRLTIDPDGRVIAATIIQSSGYSLLDTTARDWVKEQWRFGSGEGGIATLPVSFETH